MYFVTSVGSRVCAVRVEACPMPTLDTLQNTPREGPDLGKDRAGYYTVLFRDMLAELPRAKALEGKGAQES